MENSNDIQNTTNVGNEVLADVSDCALSIRKTLRHLQQEMKDYKHNKEYVDYLQEAYTKLSSAMLYTQEIRDKLKARQHYR